MMIRFAETRDFSDIRTLWDSCFPDDSGFNAYFFSHVFETASTLLLHDESTLCAMLQMLPYALRSGDRTEEVTYIYGACTAPAYRKKGYMAQLLEHSFAMDKACGRVASVLIPQQAWLFDFYKKYGYEQVFYTKNTCAHAQNIVLPCEIAVRPCTMTDVPALQKLYDTQSAACDMVLLRAAQQWKTQLSLFAALNAGIYGLFEGKTLCAYACIWRENGDLWAQELIADSPQAQTLLCAALLQQLSCERMRITTIGTENALGCAKFYDNRSISRGYFNLLFN